MPLLFVFTKFVALIPVMLAVPIIKLFTPKRTVPFVKSNEFETETLFANTNEAPVSLTANL